MNTTTSAVATGVIVGAGRWSEGKPLDLRIAIGATVFAVGLSLIGNANQELASKFALCVLIVAMFKYVPSIGKKTGLAK